MSEVTIEQVKDAFEQWRSERKNRSEAIPEALWSMAVSLYPKFKRSIICQSLGLNGAHLRHHLEKAGHVFRTEGFVLASAKTENVEKVSSELCLTLEGKQRTLTINCELSSLGKVFSQLEAFL